jgi:ParB family chromosome partitioning protein
MLLDRGQDDPINVRLMPNGRYELISGHRRVRAARLIGWSTINAQINKLDDRNAELATLVSNEGRIDLTDYEKAKTYKRAIERGFAKTQTDVARLFGCTQARVAQCLSLLNLPDQVKAILDKYPNLFGYRYGKVISDLIKEFPEGLETILLGVEQLIDNHELTSDDLRSFVEKQLVKRVRGLPTKPTLIVDSNGVSLFAVKVTDKQIIIDVKENADASIAGKHTLAALRDLAAQFGNE